MLSAVTTSVNVADLLSMPATLSAITVSIADSNAVGNLVDTSAKT
jgi:hypothetical protein